MKIPKNLDKSGVFTIYLSAITALTKTVDVLGNFQRVGDGESPIRVRCIENHFRASARKSSLVGADGFPPLKGTHIMVCCNRWYTIALLSPFTGEGFFFTKNKYTTYTII